MITRTKRERNEVSSLASGMSFYLAMTTKTEKIRIIYIRYTHREVLWCVSYAMSVVTANDATQCVAYWQLV